MKLKILIYLIFICFNQVNATLSKKPWTFLTYIAADNNLQPFAFLDIKEMQQGANDNINVLVYLNTREAGHGKITKKLIITNNGIFQDGPSMSLDSGIPSTLIDALKWADSFAPCDNIAINLWNHGSGPLNPQRNRGICFDDSTGNYLNDKDLQFALNEFYKIRKNKKIDILCFDACLMASIECNITWSDYTDYIVASQQTISAYGWNYNKVLNLVSKKSLAPKLFAIGMVDAYRETYLNIENDFTMSAITTNGINNLAKNINTVGKILIQLLKDSNKTIKDVIKLSLISSTSFDEPTYIDLNHFYLNLLNNISRIKITNLQSKITNLKNSLLEGIKLIKFLVINNSAGPKFPNASGISIYLPSDGIDISYPKLDWTQKYPDWLEFLKIYLHK